MTPSNRPSNQRVRAALALLSTVVLAAAVSCSERAPAAPPAEFIVAAGDSSFWVHSSGGAVALRGSPLVLARLDGRFLELYVEDEDSSFEDAQFVGQRLYQRDLTSGDSVEIFRDTLVPALAARYESKHPDARRLGEDEDPNEEPAFSATADVSVLGVHGPFLSIEYHVDTSGAGDDVWHMTRHTVVDLRTGKPATLADVLGPAESVNVLKRARKLFTETVDSIRRDRRPEAQRAARSIRHFRFDPGSFALAAPNGSLMIAFSAPGEGSGGEGFTLPMRPIAVTEPSWWREARDAVPSSTREREERWARPGYVVRAVYDTAARPVRLSLVDSAGREFPVGGVSAPIHRIYWLDAPALSRAQRASLTRAFDEAALYDDPARASIERGVSTFVLASRR